jgi:chemotaxis methyl-accepting protein methylase
VYLDSIEKLILNTTGIFFDENRRATLVKGVKERMAQTGTFREADYCQKLHDDQSEFFRLIKHITVNETYFFR